MSDKLDRLKSNVAKREKDPDLKGQKDLSGMKKVIDILEKKEASE